MIMSNWTLAVPSALSDALEQALTILQRKGDLRFTKRSELARALLAEGAKSIIESGDSKRPKKH
jgi:hypothetical protein